MIALLLSLLASSPAFAAAAPGAAAAPAPAAVAASTASAYAEAGVPVPAALALGMSTYTVSSLYTGDKYRDPFMPASIGVVAVVHDKNSPIDIHSLQLRGIMKDRATDFAVFTTDYGATLMLKGGKLYDERSKVMPGGITGRIKPKQKRVELMTPEKDVQIFKLGESDSGEGKSL
jgi:hypothetical protein